MYGLSNECLERILDSIRQIEAIDQVILYGSRAKGTFRMGSDINLTLRGKDLNLQNSVYPLMELLEELLLPYSFDISIYDSLSNEALLEHINRVGIVLFERSP